MRCPWTDRSFNKGAWGAKRLTAIKAPQAPQKKSIKNIAMLAALNPFLKFIIIISLLAKPLLKPVLK